MKERNETLGAVPRISVSHSPVRVVAINLAIMAVLLVILELAFGNWFGLRRLNQLNLIRSTTISYSADGLYTPSPGRIVYSRDAFGLRGAYPAPDRIDILTLGGSTTDQRYITEGETWQDVLAQEFRRRGKTVSVVNAGLDGQSTVGHIKNFDWWFPSIPNLRVRYFLFYVGINDFHVEENRSYDDLVRPTSVGSMIRDNSALYYMYRTFRGVYQAQVVARVGHQSVDFKAIQWTDHGILEDRETQMRPRLKAYRERLRVLGDKVHALGGVPVCVTQTFRNYKHSDGRILGDAATLRYGDVLINGVDQYELMQLLNRTTLESCREMGGIGVDLAGELEFSENDFYDFAHNTPQGAAKIGRYLYAKLSDRF